MNKFKQFLEMDEEWWNQRLAQFQRAAAGEKGVLSQPTNNKQNVLEKPSKTLSSEEVRRLGLHPNHNLVWIGSTADAPSSYPYVFVRAKNKYLTNPGYKS